MLSIDMMLQTSPGKAPKISTLGIGVSSLEILEASSVDKLQVLYDYDPLPRNLHHCGVYECFGGTSPLVSIVQSRHTSRKRQLGPNAVIARFVLLGRESLMASCPPQILPEIRPCLASAKHYPLFEIDMFLNLELCWENDTTFC